jgi:hypothetical protein
MSDPRTFWLIVTNIVLGLVLLLLILGIVTGVLCDHVAKFRNRHARMGEIDRDMRRLFHEARPPRPRW